jgi:hypothetical protein
MLLAAFPDLEHRAHVMLELKRARAAEGGMGFARISVGESVFVGGSEGMITHVVSADRVIVRNRRTGAVEEVPIGNIQLAPTAGSEEQRKLDLSLIRNQDWTVAQMRYEAIQPLLEAPQMDAHLLKEVAERTGRHQATIYRWRARATSRRDNRRR